VAGILIYRGQCASAPITLRERCCPTAAQVPKVANIENVKSRWRRNSVILVPELTSKPRSSLSFPDNLE